MSRDRDEERDRKPKRQRGPGPLELAYNELARKVSFNEERAKQGLPPVYKADYR